MVKSQLGLFSLLSLHPSIEHVWCVVCGVWCVFGVWYGVRVSTLTSRVDERPQGQSSFGNLQVRLQSLRSVQRSGSPGSPGDPACLRQER